MLPEPPDYEAIELNMWRENADKVIPQLNERDQNLMKQIQTYITRFGYGVDAVQEKIRSDKMFAANFATEPRRQGFHEAVAAQWLEDNADIMVKVLPKSGKDALYINRDGMIMRWPKNEGKPPSKSLDFRWDYGGKVFYAMHKYTRESGGNQDSQFKEMVQLLTNYLSASNQECALIVIVDGPYYTPAKMAELRSQTRTNPPMSFAAPIQEVPGILEAHYGG